MLLRARLLPTSQTLATKHTKLPKNRDMPIGKARYETEDFEQSGQRGGAVFQRLGRKFTSRRERVRGALGVDLTT